MTSVRLWTAGVEARSLSFTNLRPLHVAVALMESRLYGDLSSVTLTVFERNLIRDSSPARDNTT